MAVEERPAEVLSGRVLAVLVLGYLPVEVIGNDDFSVEAFGKRSTASIEKTASYDPKREKILC